MRLNQTVDQPPQPSASKRIGKINAGTGDYARVDKKVNILIVDDRADKRLALDAVLTDLNQNLVHAKSGKEALRHLLDQEFAVILLDVAMPGMDGFETASLIRKRLSSEHTPIIFVTSMNDSDNHVAKGYSLGAVDYMMTPFIPEVLRTKVSVFVELFKKTEQIKQQAERLRQIEEESHKRELAEAADKLEKETERNRFFTLALDMLGIGDFDGHLLQVNPAWEKVLGYTEAELKKIPALELLHPDDRAAIGGKIQKLKSGLSIDYFEVRGRHKDGSYRWLGWTAAPFPAEKLIYIFGRDITWQKTADEKIRTLNAQLHDQVSELTKINEELEAFSYSISHDLRAPLRSMQGFAQALLEEEQLSATGRDFATRMGNSACFMDRLIHDLLEYSLLGRTELAKMPVNVEAVLAEVLVQVDQQLRDKKAECIVISPLHPVFANSSTLSQVLVNLVTNALKFVPSDKVPRIEILTEPRNDFVRIWVKDNGIGIAPQHQKRIFGLFERLHTNQTYPGTGIGLALVRKGVERMGGRVGLESASGKGCRFWLELPATPIDE